MNTFSYIYICVLAVKIGLQIYIYDCVSFSIDIFAILIC